MEYMIVVKMIYPHTHIPTHIYHHTHTNPHIFTCTYLHIPTHIYPHTTHIHTNFVHSGNESISTCSKISGVIAPALDPSLG